MRGKANLLARKVFATIIALTMSIPPQAMASGTGPVIYDASSSVMGINQEDKSEIKVHDENTSHITKEVKNYILDIDAQLDSSLTELTYTIKARRKEKIEDDSTSNLSLNLTGLENSNITDLRLADASADIEVTENESKEDKIKTLAIKAKPADEIIYTIKATVNKAKDARVYDLKFALSEDSENFDTFSYKLKAEEKTTIENGQDIQVMTLAKDDENKANPLGTYKEEGIFGGLFAAKDTITWTDYILNEEENKEFSYDFNLDQNQETENAKIALDYYEATENGFEIKKEFSQAIDFAKKINFEIPQGFIAKITLTTQVDKKNTNVKNYSLNNRTAKNPIYIEGSEEKSLDDDEEGDKEESKEAKEEPQENSQEKAEENQEAKDSDDEIKVEDANSKDKDEEKSTKEDLKDSTIVVKDSSGNEIPLEVKENPAEDEKDKANQISALILNKDSLLSQLREENTLTTEKENAIENLAKDLDSYNDEKITDQELKDFTKALVENSNIDKSDLRFFIESILSGLNKQNNKAANLNIDEIIDYAYPENVESKDGEEDKNQENTQEKSQQENQTEEKPENPEKENFPEEKIEDNQESEKDPGKTFDEDLAKLKEEAKKDENKTGLLDGLKSLVGLSDLAKADKELKAALADEKNGIEEIQNLLNTFETKYKLSRADQAKLMDDNGEAIRALVEKDRAENFRPNIFAANANGLNLDGKKFNILTRFDTSTVVGPIRAGQFFTIHLDDALTVKPGTELKPIYYDGIKIADPQYDPKTNTIKYTISQYIKNNYQIPINIEVDYNTAKIKLDDNGEFVVVNKISGLGVTNPKSLLPQKVDKDGNLVGTIIEPGRNDVTEIIEPDGEPYKINTEANAAPVIKDGELIGYNWTVRVTSDTDLDELGYKANFTLVEGSGLDKIQDVRINGKPTGLTPQLVGAKGIVDSKHHIPEKEARELTYNFFTPTTEKQAKYMMDYSVILTEKKKNGKPKVGAKRILIEEGWPMDKVREATPNRVGMNNRTTVSGKFKNDSQVQWTITDAISTGDEKTSLPLENRGATTVGLYQINGQGEMEPVTVTNPLGVQPVGTIAVYEYTTSETSNDKIHDFAGVKVSKYEDIKIDQNWNLDQGLTMPVMTIRAVDANNESTKLGETTTTESQADPNPATRTIAMKDVKVWNIGKDGKATRYDLKIKQDFPTNKTHNGKAISYYENNNWKDPNSDDTYYIHNRATIEESPQFGNFTLIKTGEDGKPLLGAIFKLLGQGEAEVATDKDGKIHFQNIAPGSYQLKETKAPKGYKINQETTTIDVDKNGRISISGSSAELKVGGNPTVTVEDKNYPDYMNAMHYARVEDNGSITTYIYLKANESKTGGSTDKDTRLNLRLPNEGRFGKIQDVQVYDVNPFYRDYLQTEMVQQSIDQEDINYIGNTNVLNAPHKKAIKANIYTKDPFTGKSGYRITFPQERFVSDWGFLVVAKSPANSNVTYDWLTDSSDNNIVRNNSKLQKQVVTPTRAEDAQKETTITIRNEKFDTRPVEVNKWDKNKNPIAGATFEIRDAETERVIATVDSQEADKEGKNKGLASFGDLPEGKYIIEEINAPDGYVKSDVVFDVTVDSSKQVTYKPRFKSRQGTPINGVDYFIEDEEQSQDDSKVKIKNIKTHTLKINEDDEGDAGIRTGVWEAYRLESLIYNLEMTLTDSSPGQRFSIQFDHNLDFTQYFGEFPKLNIRGVDVADPYFDYTTNKLTYVFNKKSEGGEATAEIELKGIIPSKYYAQNDGTYLFTVTVEPGQTGINGNQTITTRVPADYGYYDYDRKNVQPTQSYYFRDVYKGEDGNWYVAVLAYYNPHHVRTSGEKELKFNWLSTNYQGVDKNFFQWEGNGNTPAFSLNKVNVYRTSPRMGTVDGGFGSKSVNYNMPLSFGVRPGDDPAKYNLVYSRDINPNKAVVDDRQGAITLNYDPNQIQRFGLITNNSPLRVKMPPINAISQDGYIIEQTFKIDDMNKFNNLWRVFCMTNNAFKSSFITRANYNKAIGDQAGGEIPKFFTQKVALVNKKYTPGNFKIKKLNEADRTETLQGASFSLTDENNNTIYRSSGIDGIVEFSRLKPGIYTLREEKAPDKFIKSDKTWRVNVGIDGFVSIQEIGIGSTGETIYGNTLVLDVTNKPVATEFTVYKKDNQDQPLAGAEFKITDLDGKEIATGTSDANGKVTFSVSLESNKAYILEETKAPAGYVRTNKKWVLQVGADGKTKVYNKIEGTSDPTDSNVNKSILGETGTNWVDVAKRPLTGWILGDNRQTGYYNNYPVPYKLGTRIVGKNTDQKYVIQRYVINPEADTVTLNSASIHREKPWFNNMDWYAGNGKEEGTIKIFELDKAIDGNVEDIRLENYKLEDLTNSIEKKNAVISGDNRLYLNFNGKQITKPIVIDIKVPYTSEDGGVGTGMDLYTNKGSYWKSDYYDMANQIVEGEPVTTTGEAGNIKGAYISEGSLDVSNDRVVQKFSFKKVDEENQADAVTGATFSLQGPKKSDEDLGPQVWKRSGKDGIVNFDNLTPGIYKLTETGPAQGYEKSNTDWTVTVTKDGKVYIRDNNKTPVPEGSQWQKITNLTGEDTNRDRRGGQNAMSYITEVDLAHKKYKQVFILNRNRDSTINYLEKPSIQIHSYPESRDITTNNTRITGVYEVDRTSTPDKLVNKKSINYTTDTASKEGWDRIVINPEIVANKTIAVEIEADLPSGAFGTGVDFINERPNIGKTYTSWTAEQYYDESKLKLEPLKTTGTDRNADVYIGDDKLPGGNSIVENPGINSRKPVLYSQDSGLMARNLAPRSLLNSNKEAINPMTLRSLAGADFASDGLEISGEIIPGAQQAGNVEYTINPLATKNYGGVDVSTTVRNLGSGKFEIEIHMTNVRAGSRAIGAEFELKFNDNFTFVAGSTSTWKGDDTTARWHTGYIAAENKIGVNSGEPRIGPKQTAKIKFQVQAKSDLQSGTYQLIQPIKYKHDDKATLQTIEPPTVSVKRSEPVITYRYGHEDTTIPMTTETRNDPNLEVGKTRTEEGHDGTKRTYYKYEQKDGVDTGNKTIDTTKGNNGIEIITEMKPKIIYTGTKKPGQTTYTVSHNTPENGTLSVSPTSANAGDTITVTATPNPNYKLKSLYYRDGNGNQVDIKGNSFNMPASSVTVFAEFEKAEGTDPSPTSHTITVNQPTAGGSISANLASATKGTEVSLTANPSPGYVLDSFIVTAENNDSVTVSNGKFTMPDSNVSVSATFKESKDPLDSFVPEEGKDILVKDGETIKDVRITNKKAGITPKVLKRDPGGNPVKGAKFSIKKMTDDTYEKVDTTFTEVTGEADSEGNVIFKDKTGNIVKLKKGYYVLKETESPKGYKPATSDRKMEVKDDGGRMYAVYYGPEETSTSLINNNEKSNAGKSASNAQIKYKSRLTYIDPETKTYVQRFYIDTRGYTGSDKINVQITPKHKREEIDTPGAPPKTTKGGVKTAYFTAYRITDPAKNPDIGGKNFDQIDFDTMLRTYDLSRSDMSMIKTARWRPFDWGFDEDQLNLDKGGVYIVDVEGFYDDDIIKGTDEITEDDIGKLDLNIDFYDGERHFKQLKLDKNGNPIYEAFKGASFQGGADEVYEYIKNKDGKIAADAWKNVTSEDGKYPNFVGRKVKYNGKTYETGKIDPPLGKPTISGSTRVDLNPLYNSEKSQEVPKEGLEVINERETYNITFSKHGRDGDKDKGWGDNGEKVTKNRLEGAVFRLEVRGPGGTYEEVPGTTVASAFNGYFGFRGLEPGRYRLIEVKAPPGYRPIKDPILYMTISYTGEVVDGETGEVTPGRGLITLEYNENANGIIQYTPGDEATEEEGKLVDFVTSGTAKNMGKIINEQPGKGKVELTKLNDNKNILPGAKFKLTRLTSKEVINPGDKDKPDGIYYGTANNEGKVIFQDLPIGQYELEEIEAPNGYVNKGQKWRFTVGGPGLDPYINEGETPIRDISSRIKITSSEMTVVRPDAKEGDTTGNSIIEPHKGEALAFKNKFKLTGDSQIKEGDYFTIKLTDNIDLEGILRGNTSGLDLFADGIGTIAKAKYDKAQGTLTYIFTSYGEQYSMEEFENTISAHINLYAVPSSSKSETVGFGIYDRTKNAYIGQPNTNDIEVKYDLDMAEQSLDLSDSTEAYKLNMTSKIVSFNTETGDFVQYFYINRDMKEARNLVFNYTPNTVVSNLRFDVINLRQNYGSIYDYDTGQYVNPITRDMPESFGVNEYSNNLSWNRWYGYYNLNANQTVPINLGGYGQYDSMILKVTGRVNSENIASYETTARLSGSKFVEDRYGRVYEYPGYVTRTNGVRIFENKANASAELKFTAINPKNEITFKKVDEDGVILEGAKFVLYKKNSEGKWIKDQYPEQTSDKDGLIKFEKLAPGEYALVETEAPEGYTKIDGHVVEFTVEKDGTITRKVPKTKENAQGLGFIQRIREAVAPTAEETVSEPVGLEPIEVVNHKDIEFVKVDAENNETTLKDAEFEVYYKEKETDKDYKPLKVKKAAEDGTETEVTMTVSSGEDGKFKLNLTKPGYYALKETKAPEGYSKMPGYIKEFKLENGKVQILEKDPLKASHKTSTKGLLTSEIISVDKENNTFKQRIIINPNHTEMKIPSYESYIRIKENDWKITPKYKDALEKENGIGGLVNVALIKKDGDKTLESLTKDDFKKYDAISFTTAGNITGSRYGLKEMLGITSTTDEQITTTESIVMEFTGKLDDNNETGTADQLFELVLNVEIDDQVSDTLNIENLASDKPAYADHDIKNPIQVENRKAEYPLTGGPGIWIGFTIAGLAVMIGGAYIYHRRKESIETNN